MKYKSKNDIPYVKFQTFVDEIKGHETEEAFVAAKIFHHFNTIDFESFNDALNCKAPIKLPFKIDMEFNTAGKFIDADNYIRDNEVIEFLKLVLKKKHWYSRKINYNKISLGQVEYILSLFTNAQPQ